MVKSKIWLVFNNEGYSEDKARSVIASKPQKKLVHEYEDEKTSSSGIENHPIGIVYEHPEDGLIGPHIYGIELLQHTHIRDIEGRLLTMVDATYSDKQQREAHKSLVRQLLWDYHRKTTENIQQVFEHTEVIE